LLLLNEITGTNLFLHLTFGLLKGWWAYEDPELRVLGCPALSAESWATVLSSEGFGAISFPAQEEQRTGTSAYPYSQQVIVAAMSSPISPTSPSFPMNKLHEALTHIVSDLLKVRVEEIDHVTALSEYGFDSITFIQGFTPPFFLAHLDVEYLNLARER
jgi:polyketide synthase PksM